MFIKPCESDQCHIQNSQKLWKIGRLLLLLRPQNKRLTTKDYWLNSSCFSTIVDATRILAGFNIATCELKIPSIALKIGTLKKLASIIESLAIEMQDRKKEMDATVFFRCMILNWTDNISHNALKTLTRPNAKWNNPTFLHMTEDIQKLQVYLKGQTKNF